MEETPEYPHLSTGDLRPKTKDQRLKTPFFVFFIALSMVIGQGYNMYLHYDFSHTIDTKTYLSIAKGDFKDQSMTRRYRVLVPFASAVIAYPISKMYTWLWPQRGEDEWPLRLAFYIVNSILCALAAVVIFNTCRLYGATVLSSFIAMTAILAGRWMNYTVGLPMTDSLYLLVVALTIYGIKAKDPKALIFCIFIGPFAKESFLFVAPIIFFWGCIPKWKQVIYFVLSGALVFGTRYLIDKQTGTTYSSSFLNAFDHSENFSYSLHRIFSAHGVGELFTIMGTFTFLILAGFLGGRSERKKWIPLIDWPCIALILALIVHALLSSEVARMLFFGSPVWALMIALILDRHKWFMGYRRLFGLQGDN
jgi:hypothetical protein